MPASDYAASTGGALKLKGGSSGVTKKKKKRTKPSPADGAVEASSANNDDVTQTDTSSNVRSIAKRTEDNDDHEHARDELQKHKATGAVKTEAELRFEEKRRKRMEERLRKEGGKTHKERVEDLNRYLSKLSEHHDMPRIGPG